MRRTVLFFLAGCLVLAGCAGNSRKAEDAITYISEVNSFSAGIYTGGKRYAVSSGMSGVGPDDMEFTEYSALIVQALSRQGYSLADSSENVDLTIRISYSISKPQMIPYTTSSPVYGAVDARTVNFTIEPQGNNGVPSTGTATIGPSTAVVGYSQDYHVREEYTRQIEIIAYSTTEKASSGDNKCVWKTTITSKGSCGTLRKLVPFMVKAAEDYLGSNQLVKVGVRENGDKTIGQP